MAPSFVTYGEKPEALEADESSAGDGCDKPRAIIAAKSTATSRPPMICRRGMLMRMVCISCGMRDDSSSEARGPAMPPGYASLRTWGRRRQDVVVLGENPILLGIVLVALVARKSGAFGHLRFERVLVAEAEVGPVAGFVLEALRVLYRDRQPREVAQEVAFAA